jgi:hypothetical protein
MELVEFNPALGPRFGLDDLAFYIASLVVHSLVPPGSREEAIQYALIKAHRNAAIVKERRAQEMV